MVTQRFSFPYKLSYFSSDLVKAANALFNTANGISLDTTKTAKFASVVINQIASRYNIETSQIKDITMQVIGNSLRSSAPRAYCSKYSIGANDDIGHLSGQGYCDGYEAKISDLWE